MALAGPLVNLSSSRTAATRQLAAEHTRERPVAAPQQRPKRCRPHRCCRAGAAAEGGAAEPFNAAPAESQVPAAMGHVEPDLGAAGGAQDSGSRWSIQNMKEQMATFGLAGVTAYGLFNTLYYTATFLFFWVYVAKVPAGQGVAASAKAFAGVMAMVWAGSQVTKAPRAAAALMLAPLVDRGMAWLQRALGLRTRRAVFLVFLTACLGLAAVLFGTVVLLWS